MILSVRFTEVVIKPARQGPVNAQARVGASAPDINLLDTSGDKAVASGVTSIKSRDDEGWRNVWVKDAA